ncbi:MAG: glycosyltransferase family 4 protein [Candidatus Bathyarchaeia archaeon]
MKVALIHTPLVGRGGGQRQILNLAFELQRIGHEVEIFTSAVNKEKCYPELIEKLTINVISHPLGNEMPKWFIPSEIQQKANYAEPAESSSLRSWMRKAMGRQFYTIPYDFPSMLNIGRKIPKGFDIINNHNFPSEWAAFFAKKRLNAPVVWMCNEPPDWFFASDSRKGLRKINWPIYEMLDKTASKYIDEILVLSKIAQGHVDKAYHRSSRIVRSGVDVELFHNASGTDIREKYGLGEDFVLLQVGNFQLSKGQTDSIRTLYNLSKNYDQIKLILDGGGRKEELVRLSERLGVRNKVLFLHSNDDEELAKVYAACDVFLFPQQITWGLALIEAMSASKPVIVSNKCGGSEIIQSNVNGIVFDQAKPEEITKQVELLINNTHLRKKLGEHAYEYVKSNLSWEKYARTMETIFEEALLNFNKKKR